jgi:RNA polymerase sigma-70 factor (ECF subfamily)
VTPRASSANAFELQRPRLKALAYRLLGSWSDAEDTVQDAYVRWEQARAAGTEILDDAPWLTRVVVNLCLDARKSRARRETYVGPWLPEPVSTQDGALGGLRVDPDEVSLAFLALLERLSALERAAYVLSVAFEYDTTEIAAVLDRSEAAVRQLVHRAREHVEAGRPRFRASAGDHQRMLGAFLGACASGDLESLKRMLADDAVVVSDGGGKQRAARRPVVGADRAARLLIGILRKAPEGLVTTLGEINGRPSLVIFRGGAPFGVVQIETDGERIGAVSVVVNPDKLAHVLGPDAHVAPT